MLPTGEGRKRQRQMRSGWRGKKDIVVGFAGGGVFKQTNFFCACVSLFERDRPPPPERMCAGGWGGCGQAKSRSSTSEAQPRTAWVTPRDVVACTGELLLVTPRLAATGARLITRARARGEDKPRHPPRAPDDKQAEMVSSNP